MPFHVYPDPQTAALSVAPGATTFAAITQLTGASVPAGAYPKMMFARVAVSGGAAAPTLSLKAGTGTAVTLTTMPTAVYRTAAAAPADYVGDVQLFTVGEHAGVLQLRLGFDQDTAETLQLGITNNDAAARDFTWVVADAIADTAQPWIDVSPATLTYASLVNETINLSVQVANKGTGPLNVTAVNPALPAGFTLGTPLPLAVAEGQTQPLVVTFTAGATPPAGGLTTGTADLVATPADSTALTAAGHNQRVALSATTQQLEVVLLLDDSGSMSWDPLGTPLAAGDPNARWSELVSAANQFLDSLSHFGHGRGQLGVARFPAENPLDPATFDIFPPAPIPDLAGMGAVTGKIAAVVPHNGTPMGDGLDRVLATATSYFGPDTFNRRWLILMSDGAHNAGTHNPLEFIAPPVGTAAVGASLAERKIELFAVAYGIEGHSDVNHVLMKQLSDGSLAGGQIRNVDQPHTTAQDLATALRDTLKSGLTAAVSPLDPAAVFVIGDGEQRHDVVITEFDTRAAFTLSWNTSNFSRLRLELITPLCEVITPESAASGMFSGVTFRGTDRSHMYLIDPRFLRNSRPTVSDGDGNGGGSRRPRYGTWTFVVTSPSSGPIGIAAAPEIVIDGGVDLEPYVYDVLVDSTLRLEPSQDRPTYFAGDPITVSARLTADGRPVTGASVSLSTTLLDGSVANFLAGLVVPAEALERARQQLAGQDATPLLVKQLGARLAGFVFDIGQRTVTIPMTDPDGTGVYRATVGDTSVPEQYTFYITANGVTDDGVPFHREGKLQTFVLVRPEAAFSNLDLRQVGAGQVQATIIPRDRFGNVLLIDPTTAGGFGLTAPGATLGPLTSNLDGSYGTAVTFDPNHPPAIGFQFDGDPVITPTPVPALGKLIYANQVVKFDQGQIISANRHADPRAALGSVATKPADTFVSLGARGQLTVAVKDKAIKGGRPDDVTVFVTPDADLRSYRVEALVRGDDDNGHGHDHGADHGDDHGHDHSHDRWVLLGTSIGVTQSFGLATAHLRSTAAIRITDTSGRTRDANSVPLATPGVSVRGVGARQVGADDDDDDDGNGNGNSDDHGHGGGRGGMRD